MAETTIRGYSKGFNCLMRVGGYGRRPCRVLELAYGLGVIPGSDSADEAANRRVFYPLVTTGSSFGLVVVHLSWQERDSFNRWIRGYWEAVASGSRTVSGTMRVDVPARNWSKICIPQSRLTYGEDKGQADPTSGRGVFTTTLDFVGASEPLDKSSKEISFFTPSKDKTAAYFYPAAKQVSGAESLEGTIFDDTPEPVYTDAQARKDYQEMRDSGVLPANVSYDKYRNIIGIP